MKEPLRGEERIAVRAPADRVWALLADVTRMGDWSPECRRAEWLGGATAAVSGARFLGRSRIGPYRWARTCAIVTAEPERELSFATLTKHGQHQTVWRYRLEPGEGGTVLAESFDVVGPVDPLARMMLATRSGRRLRLRQVRRGMRHTLERIKAAAEAG